MSDRQYIARGAAFAALVVAIIFLTMVATGFKARAEWVRRCQTNFWGYYECERVWREPQRTYHKVWREREYSLHYRRPSTSSSDPKCRPFLAVVGDQYATEDGARGEADKAWMQTARWQWGERYMSREHADDAAYECGRSSVGSLVGQIFYRCRLTAKPCRPDSKEK